MADQIAGEEQKAPAENAGEAKAGEEKGTKAEGEAGKKEEPPKEEPPEDPAKHEVPVRKSAASFIIERQKQKIEKLAAKPTTPKEELDENGEPIIPEKNDEITPQARQAIQEEIAPIVEHFTKDADERSRNSEITEYLSKNSEHAKYEPFARRYTSSKEYQGVPAEVIFHHLAFRDAEAQGAKKAQLAAEEAKRKGAGADSRKVNDSDQPDFKNMSDSDFREWQRKNLGY